MSHQENHHKRANPALLNVLIVSGIILAIAIAVFIGLSIGRHGSKPQPIQVNPVIQAPPPIDTTQSDQKKAEQKQQLNACIDGVNTSVSNAIANTDTSEFNDPAAYNQQVLQLQQTFIAECQAKYGQN